MKFEDISIGDIFSLERKFTRQDGRDFARLSGDFNKLHLDADFGAQSKFEDNIVYGLLAGSLFSALVGMRCPGENALYLSQTMNFRQPIFYEEKLTATAEVIQKNENSNMITLKTKIIKNGHTAIDGEAKVIVL
ncbi:MAG: MaoC family dehydratase [Candidatus Falkowbacteria bacterium]